MSAGVMLKSLHKVSRYSLAVLKAPLVSSYHTERGVFGYRPRRANSETPDAELQALLKTHSSLNQGQVGSLFYVFYTQTITTSNQHYAYHIVLIIIIFRWNMYFIIILCSHCVLSVCILLMIYSVFNQARYVSGDYCNHMPFLIKYDLFGFNSYSR